MLEYHQEIVPVHSLAAVCSAAAADGWRAVSVVGGLGVQAGPLSQPEPGCLVLLERAKAEDAGAKRNGVLLAGKGGAA